MGRGNCGTDDLRIAPKLCPDFSEEFLFKCDKFLWAKGSANLVEEVLREFVWVNALSISTIWVDRCLLWLGILIS